MRPDWTLVAIQDLRNQKNRVFSERALLELISFNRSSWGAPAGYTSSQLLQRIGGQAGVRELKIKSPSGPPLTRLTFGEPSDYSVALSIRPRSYLSHATALVLHNLTEQDPGTIYVNQEQSAKPTGGSITQEALTRAFERPARKSNYVWQFGSRRITLISGKQTSRLGVIPFDLSAGETVDLTGLERTLVDVVVRPAYAGGVFQVLEAFKAAKDRVSAPQLLGVLRQLQYVYPYHQALGIYLEAAGYPSFVINEVHEIGMQFDFFLAHDMRDKKFVPRWRVFIPSGFPLQGQAR